MGNVAHFLPQLCNQRSKSGRFHIYVVSNDQSFLSQYLKVLGSSGEKFDFLLTWDLKFKAVLITRPQKQAAISQRFKTISERKKSDT